MVSVSRYFSKASLTWTRVDSSCIASIALETNDVYPETPLRDESYSTNRHTYHGQCVSFQDLVLVFPFCGHQCRQNSLILGQVKLIPRWCFQ